MLDDLTLFVVLAGVVYAVSLTYRQFRPLKPDICNTRRSICDRSGKLREAYQHLPEDLLDQSYAAVAGQMTRPRFVILCSLGLALRWVGAPFAIFLLAEAEVLNFHNTIEYMIFILFFLWAYEFPKWVGVTFARLYAKYHIDRFLEEPGNVRTFPMEPRPSSSV